MNIGKFVNSFLIDLNVIGCVDELFILSLILLFNFIQSVNISIPSM